MEYAFYYNNTNKQIITRVYSGGSNTIYRNFLFNVDLGTTWKNLILTYDTNIMKLYVDGVLINGTFTTVGTYVGMSNTTIPLTIGQLYQYTPITFGGNLDEVVIWNKELSQAEVTEIYNKQNSGLELI
jgi:hypothetical protein